MFQCRFWLTSKDFNEYTALLPEKEPISSIFVRKTHQNGRILPKNDVGRSNKLSRLDNLTPISVLSTKLPKDFGTKPKNYIF